MQTVNYEYWPFTLASGVSCVPQPAEQIAFLEAAHDKGFESFRFGVNDYGARSSERERCILERGRSRWEIRLSENEHRRCLAFVDGFRAAAQAVELWLNGTCAKEIIEIISKRLVTPLGAKASHVITEDDCET